LFGVVQLKLGINTSSLAIVEAIQATEAIPTLLTVEKAFLAAEKAFLAAEKAFLAAEKAFLVMEVAFGN
jgi:hypothetical protein